MKKTVLAVFSVSLTAGTCCLAYSELKKYQIKSLINGWQKLAEKKKATIDKDQLATELDKLNAWDLKLLSDYYSKITTGASAEEKEKFYKRLEKRKVPEKVDLSPIEKLLII